MQSPHYHKHRQRLRDRFRETGFSGFRDYEALELLLTYAIPRKDVKPIAKELVSTFGSFRKVLDAPYEEIVRISGIKENSATFIGLIKECAALYLKEDVSGEVLISSTGALLDYLRVVMAGLRDEQFRTVFLNSRNVVVADEVIQEGTVNQSVVYPRKVMERALYHKATAMIFVHNHPGGGCKPSAEDKQITLELQSVADGLGIRVHDHIIICKDGYFSFLEEGLL